MCRAVNAVGGFYFHVVSRNEVILSIGTVEIGGDPIRHTEIFARERRHHAHTGILRACYSDAEVANRNSQAAAPLPYNTICNFRESLLNS